MLVLAFYSALQETTNVMMINQSTTSLNEHKITTIL